MSHRISLGLNKIHEKYIINSKNAIQMKLVLYTPNESIVLTIISFSS